MAAELRALLDFVDDDPLKVSVKSYPHARSLTLTVGLLDLTVHRATAETLRDCLTEALSEHHGEGS